MDHRGPRAFAGRRQCYGTRARPPGAGDAGAGNGGETGRATLRRRGQGSAAWGRRERRRGDGGRGARWPAGAAGPTAATPDSPPAAAPQDSLAPPGRRRRGRIPGRGGCREPVPRATGPAARSDSRRLEQPSHKRRRASGARRKDVSALPAAVGGAPGSCPGYLRTHGRCVQRAGSGGPGGCARPRWACDVGRGPGAEA